MKLCYFFEPNPSIISDLEGYFILNDDFELFGVSQNSQGISEVINNQIDICIISDNLPDIGYKELLKELSVSNAKIILAYTNLTEIEKQSLSDKNIALIKKPYTFNELVKVINGAKNCSKPVEIHEEKNGEESIENHEMHIDNPFESNIPLDSKIDISEKLRENRARLSPRSDASKFMGNKLGTVVSIHNQKGGVGKSTTAVNLATACANVATKRNGQIEKPNILFCDFDIDACGDCCYMLNVNGKEKNLFTLANDLKIEQQKIMQRTGNTVSLQNIMFTEDRFVKSYLSYTNSGFYFLAAPQSKKEAFSINRDVIISVLRTARKYFDLIIIDTGPNVLTHTITALDESDIIYCVCTQEITPAQRLASLFSEVPSLKNKNVKLVINKYSPDINILPQEIAEILNMEVVGIIPYFKEISNLSNEGVSSFTNRAKDQKGLEIYNRAIKNLAYKTLGLDTIVSQNPMDQKKSFFKRIFRK